MKCRLQRYIMIPIADKMPLSIIGIERQLYLSDKYEVGNATISKRKLEFFVIG